MSRHVLLLIPFLAAGCASGGGPGTPDAGDAPRLAWDRAPAAPVSYVVADTGSFTMNIPGMGEAPVDIRSRVTADLAFERDPAGGLRVTASVTDLAGTFSSPAGPGVSVDADDAPPPAVVRVTPEGVVTLVDETAFAGSLAQITSPGALYRSFFVRLPDEAVSRGATWTDTVRISERQSGMQSEMTQVIRSTWSRDTVVDGTPLVVITSAITTDMQLEGANQGVEIRQQLSGSSNAVTLWDPAAGLIVQRTEEGTATGTADLPGFDMTGIAVNARSRQVVRRVPR